MIAVEKEILITLAGALIIVLITMVQIWAMSRARSRHHKKMMALENSSGTGESIGAESSSCRKKSCSLFCNVGHLLQIVFGILVFVGFTCWAVYLVSVGFIEWAPLPGSLALIGLATPIIAWRGYKHRHQAMARLLHDREVSPKATVRQEQPAAVAPIPSEPEIAAAEPVAQPVTAPPAPIVAPEQPAVIRSMPVAIGKRKLPQDSILRRHFLTHLRTQVESLYPPRPTDSILKRHFDNFIAAEMEKYVDGPIESEITRKPPINVVEAPAIVSAAVAASAVEPPPSSSGITQTPRPKLPQDSILRRHFLTQLRFDIEAGLPPRPTDSILKRHYDSLLMTELAKRLEQMEA